MCSYLLFFFSLQLIFTLFGGRLHFSFLTRRYKIFMFNWPQLFFISYCSSSSLLHVNVDI